MTAVKNAYMSFIKLFDCLAPLYLLAARFWVAKIFFMSGLTKIKDMESTLWLFHNEYKVPFINPDIAAYAGTAAELILPPLLLLGFCGRFAALVLFIFNIVAVVSYPQMGAAGMHLHYFWGALIASVLFFGPGKLSLDNWMCKKCDSK